MADLQSCYFCGAPDEVQAYAVIPPRLGGDDRSVPLCESCKTKLLRVMEPLIEQVENGDSTTEAASPEGQQRSESAAGVTMRSSQGERGDSAVDHETTGAESSETGAAATGAVGADSDDTPPSYRRAMRMLSNRPFPVNRTEVESMLAAAYDLEREEVDAVIDYAIDEGQLVEENGQLSEP